MCVDMPGKKKSALLTFPGLRLLAMKQAPIEKFQYLVHLKATNPHLFYRLLGENIKVRNNQRHFAITILT
jgi:hypothetical protein